ncbi:cytochrome P450 2J1-like isoform X2 [Dromiciops gliroides]|uniref:cytochrome P450 2J1-like isoform X2 n=1 Tax=Dromiciops gliroides TaxID=33562 RepID=UPI001CC561F8|nr:cytochrome P450 2J1-like isoform X2 [Dromiciops gliroides]
MRLPLGTLLPSLWEGAPLHTLLLFAILLILAYYLQRRGQHLNYPPSPPGLPIVGNLFQMDFKTPHITVQKFARKYGNIFCTHVGGFTFMFVSGLPMIKEVLVNQDQVFIDRPSIPTQSYVFQSPGLVMSNGDQWRQQRRFALMTLRNFGLGKKTLEDRIREEARYLIEAIREEKGSHQKLFEEWKKLESFVECVIKQHKEDFNPEETRDFIDAYLQELSKDTVPSSFNEKSLVSCTLDLFLAGTETTSTTLRWALLYMALYPDIQGKIQAEIDRVIGQSRQPMMADKEKMPYTNAAIHEVQRMGNIIPFNVPRMAAIDTKVAGYHVPKGTILMTNLTALHKDPEEWDTPETFNPEHFLENGQFKKRESFLPFSIGKRVCLGEQLARAELFLFFTCLLQNFTFQAPPDTQLSLDFRMGITISPIPYQICALPRVM